MTQEPAPAADPDRPAGTDFGNATGLEPGHHRLRVTAADGVELSVLLAGPPPGAQVDVTLPPILAVHGFASAAWNGWVRTGHIAALTAAGRVVIAPDLRGHGLSGKPHRIDAYRLDIVIADLAQVAEEATGAIDAWESGGRPADWRASGLDLMGYSLGSRLLWTVARVRALPVRRAVLGGFDGRPLFQGIDTERLEKLAAGIKSNDTTALRTLVAALKGAGGPAEGGELGEVPGAPTMIVAGDRDPIASGAAAFAAGLPRGQFLSIERRGHISAVTSAEYRRSAVEFLASH